MTTQIPDPGQMFERVGVQLCPRKRRLIFLVVGAEKKGYRAALAHARFQVGDQRAPDPSALVLRTYGQWVQFSDVSIVMGLCADHPQDGTLLVYSHVADVARLKQIPYLFQCRLCPGSSLANAL